MHSSPLPDARLRIHTLTCAAAALTLGCGGLEPSAEPWKSAAAGAMSAAQDAKAVDATRANDAGSGGATATGGAAGIAGSRATSARAGSTATAPAGPDDDDVYGTPVARADSWWVAAGRIHRGSEEIRLYGVSWFGLEGDSRALFGPSESKRSVADFISQLKSLGFNALRVPLSPDSIRPGVASAGWASRGSIDTGREQFEELAKAAVAAGMYLLLDIHTCASAVGYTASGPTDPKCTGYGVEGWLADLRTLADLADTYAPFVLGIDLFNEPYALTFAEWRTLAEQGGRAVLQRNPHILIFVEGVGGKGYSGFNGPFWGENLTGVATMPVDLPASRLVYSPHVYGPSVSAQAYFNQADFPKNMPEIWDEHFGYLMGSEHAVVPGEFGGMYTGNDRAWQDAFVDYLAQKQVPGFFYWCLNPNSGDTGGLLQADWRSVNNDKLALLKRLMQ